MTLPFAFFSHRKKMACIIYNQWHYTSSCSDIGRVVFGRSAVGCSDVRIETGPETLGSRGSLPCSVRRRGLSRLESQQLKRVSYVVRDTCPRMMEIYENCRILLRRRRRRRLGRRACARSQKRGFFCVLSNCPFFFRAFRTTVPVTALATPLICHPHPLFFRVRGLVPYIPQTLSHFGLGLGLGRDAYGQTRFPFKIHWRRNFKELWRWCKRRSMYRYRYPSVI